MPTIQILDLASVHILIWLRIATDIIGLENNLNLPKISQILGGSFFGVLLPPNSAHQIGMVRLRQITVSQFLLIDW